MRGGSGDRDGEETDGWEWSELAHLWDGQLGGLVHALVWVFGLGWQALGNLHVGVGVGAVSVDWGQRSADAGGAGRTEGTETRERLLPSRKSA